MFIDVGSIVNYFNHLKVSKISKIMMSTNILLILRREVHEPFFFSNEGKLNISDCLNDRI